MIGSMRRRATAAATVGAMKSFLRDCGPPLAGRTNLRSRPHLPSLATAVLALTVLGLAVAGCGAGQRAQTAEMLPRAPGVNAASPDGTILVRNASIEFPGPEGYAAGETATVQLSVFNDGTAPVRLVSLESLAASGVRIEGGELGPAPTGQATADPTPTSGPSGSEAPDLEIPAGGYVHTAVHLTGLRQAVDGTGSVPLTLGFSGAGGGQRLDLTVPMAPPDTAQPRSPMPLGEGTEEH